MSVQFDDYTDCLLIEPALLKAPQSGLDEIGLLHQDASDLGLRVTVASPGASYARLVDSPDHRHLGVDVGEVILARSAAPQVLQLPAHRFPASFIALDPFTQPGTQL